MTPFGLGAIASPPDQRDFQIELDMAAPLPASYTVPKRAPIYNQGQTPECVAYSAAGEQDSFDLAELGHNYLWDFNLFFKRIGGTANGAIIRDAFKERLKNGYPLLPANSGNSASSHKIAAYYAIPLNEDAIKRAIVQYGRIILGTPWANSWFTPGPDGSLPEFDYAVGGHAIDSDEYDPIGLWLDNSWGLTYGKSGRVRMSWSDVLKYPTEAWKATDAK